ncbi:major capsid protein [Lactococcus phage vB_LLc_bIBB14]|uniref:Major capsid protein n=1 Tax=Lactococcus phage vB_LLc_bIBB14 TaxID=2305480 RepID=A0A678VIA8_9CAUD|nr:head maturation protease [Lactococcus phage vB_LLc_bIBB14]AXY83573.1 major capsid protein [Lactococcus phage vB_LLc_bIBB14]
MKVKAVRGIANPLGTIDSHGTVIESIANAGDGVDILNRHREKIGSGFVHLEGNNVILTGYVDEEQYTAEKIEETGLSVGFNANGMKAREIDGVGYYKDVTITEVSLTPLPSNKGAKVTKVREKNEEDNKGEQEQMTVNETQEIMKQAIEAGVKVRELEAQVIELNKEREELKKEREASIPSEKPQDVERKFMRELGSKMVEMPEQGFLREFANASALNVVNSLGSITSKYARKSGIYDGAMKARFQGLTLAEDGVDDTFLQDTFKAGTDKNKAQTATKRSLRPQMAEAYLQMDKATVRGVNDSGALSEYVMSEMVNRVIQKVEYNMILGSADGSNGFYGLKTATDGWTKQIEYTDLFEGITDAVAECSISDSITIVMSPQTFAELRKAKGTDGHSRFNELATKAQIAQSFGAVNLETRVWMPKDEVAVYNHDEYVLIGDLNMENYNDFDLRYNVEQWLSETLVGGSIRGKNRSAYLKKKGSLGV